MDSTLVSRMVFRWSIVRSTENQQVRITEVQYVDI